MPSITPSPWFDHNLEEAATFYTSVFPNSRIEDLNRSTDAGPGNPGSILSGTFVLDGTRFFGTTTFTKCGQVHEVWSGILFGLAGFDQFGLVQTLDRLDERIVNRLLPTAPTEGRMPASASRSLNRIEVNFPTRARSSNPRFPQEDERPSYLHHHVPKRARSTKGNSGRP